MRKRRRGGSDQAAHEATGMMRWLLTYADLITLLMAFFVIMYAISSINTQRYELLSTSMRQAFNGRPAIVHVTTQMPQNRRLGTQSTATNPAAPALAQLYEQLKLLIRQRQLADQTSVRLVPQGVVVSIPGQALFPSAQATLLPGARRTLTAVAALLRQLPNQVAVQGYTDSRPIRTARFPSNWELSLLRATAVVHFLVGQGVAPTRLSATGFGKYHPVATNATPAGRQANRRVDIVVLYHSASR